MAVQIYKVTRVGGMGVRFEGKDGTDFTDPTGLGNPQVARIVGKRLFAYVRCEVGAGTAEVVGEASEEEVAVYEGRGGEEEGDAGDMGAPFKFPGR
jgi:hypothetical protein